MAFDSAQQAPIVAAFIATIESTDKTSEQATYATAFETSIRTAFWGM